MSQNLLMIRSLKTLVFFVFSFVLFSSCKKDNSSPTQGQLVGARLKAALTAQTITQVYVYDYSTGTVRNTGTAVEVDDDGILSVLYAGSGQSFNLESLIAFSISGATLFLYF